jgi:glycosyltransferase involved in cell wall biosynthesis
MRIIEVLNSPNWSGASQYCLMTCLGLHRRGHDLLLITEPGKPLERAKAAGIPFDASIRLNHRNPALYLHAIRRFRDLFRQFKPDIIACHINEGAWMAGLVARHVCPETAIVRTRTDIDPPKSHFINRYVHHHWTDRVIAGSHLHKRECRQRLDLPDSAIDVVYGPVNHERFSPSVTPSPTFRAEIGADRQTVVIGLLARLDPIKGHEFALAALGRLARHPIPWKLVLLGYENQRTFAWAHERAAHSGIGDRVCHVTWRDDLPAVLAAIDIGLISSIGSEANSRATLEFMATGKPVVATSVGVIPEIIQHEEHGLLVPPADPEALARELARLLGNPLMRASLGRQARRRVEENFAIAPFVERTEAAYCRALAQKRPVGPMALRETGVPRRHPWRQ